MEAIPDQDFYYLIGVVVIEEFDTRQFSFWADNQEDESTIYRKLLEILGNYKDFTLFHYGSFETQFITRMNKKYSDSNLDRLEQIQAKAINVLSMIYGKIYFPTYTNGLKEIGKYLGGKWSEANATGLQSLVWRHQWEKSHDPHLYKKLVRYNLEDCYALKRVVETITRISDGLIAGTEIVSIEEIPNKSTYKFGQVKYLFQELEFVNTCAYFDYQREKIFFRDRKKKNIKVRKKDTRRASKKCSINKKVELPIPSNCTQCTSVELYRHGRKYKTVWDIKFFNFGVNF